MSEQQEQYEKLKELVFTADEDNIETAFTIADGLGINFFDWFQTELDIIIELFPYENFEFLRPRDLAQFLRRDTIRLNGYDNLHVKMMTELPKELLIFRFLKKLRIDNTNIKTLPDWLDQFQELEYLGIDTCPIKSISIKNLYKLNNLYLGNCPITLLPNEVTKLSNLAIHKLPLIYIQKELATIEKHILSFVPLDNHMYYFHQEVINANNFDNAYRDSYYYQVVDENPKFFFLKKMTELVLLYSEL